MCISTYISVKDKVCFLHAGHNIDYILQLKTLRPAFEKLFPGIYVTLVVREEYAKWMEGDSNWVTMSYHHEHKHEWAYNIPVVYDAVKGFHPILKQIETSEIPVSKIPVRPPGTEFGVICTEGNYPVMSLTEEKIDFLKKWVRSKGFKPLVLGTSLHQTVEKVDLRPNIDEKLNFARHAGVVVGVECDVFWEATLTGTPTALVPTGLGEPLYRMFCARPVILS
jgi:hypothetical protein